MASHQQHHTGRPHRSTQGGFGTATPLLLAMADTTWRMFTPVVISVGVGIWADLRYHTKPWLTLLGLVVGFVGAVMLVRAQIKSLEGKD